MAEQQLAVSHRNHVVMKHPRIDHTRMLLREYGVFCIEAVQACDRLGGFLRLARGEARWCRGGWIESLRPINKKFYATFADGRRKARVIGGTFVAERRARRQRSVMRKTRLISEHCTQDSGRRRVLHRAVELVVQIGRREVHASIRRICTRTHRRRVGRPHGRGRHHAVEHQTRVAGSGLEHSCVIAIESNRAQHRKIRPLLRRQHALLPTTICQRLHLGEPLQRRQFRVGNHALIFR